MTSFHKTLSDIAGDTLGIERTESYLTLIMDDGAGSVIQFGGEGVVQVADALVSALPEYLQRIEPEPEEWETADVVIADWGARRIHFIRQGNGFLPVRWCGLEAEHLSIEDMRPRNPVAVQIDGQALLNESEAA